MGSLYNADVAFVGKKLPTTTKVADNDHGVPAIGIQTRFISLQMSLV